MRMKMKYARIAVCLFAFLCGHALAQDPQFPGEWFDGVINYAGNVPGLEHGPVVTTGAPDEPRCLADQFSVPSQGLHVSGSGLHVSGSVGGMVLGPINVLNEDGTPDSTLSPVSVDSAWQMSGAANWLAGLGPKSSMDVIIWVVDDFSGNKFQIPSAAFELQQDDEDDLESMVKTGELSHGALVMHHVNALLSAADGLELDSTASDPAAGYAVWTFKGDSSNRVIVRGADLSRGLNLPISTDSIVSTIHSAAESLFSFYSEQQQETHFVINMSWVLLPCPTVEAFSDARADFATFEEYLRGLEVPSYPSGTLSGGDTYTENVLRLLSLVGPDDDLLEEIHNPGPTSTGNPLMIERYFPDAHLAIVAATGNFGMGYQMLPAAWPLVVGAGAPDTPLPPFSNEAEVLAPGAWFKLEPLVGFYPELPPGTIPQISYAGTSFSAPMVSLLAAIDIMTTDLCTPSDFRATSHGLATEPHSNVPVVQRLGACGTSP